MKQRWTALLLCLALLISVTAASAAEDTESGFYRAGSAEQVKIVPVTASGETVTAVARSLDESGEGVLFYPGSQALRVTLSDTAPGKQYLLTVSAGDTVYYADQQTGGGELSFNVAFRLPEKRTELSLNVGSNAPGFVKQSVTLGYAPDLPKKDYASCPRDESCLLSAFADLNRTAWYHDGVHWALEQGVMRGVADDTFLPGGSMSRAMLVTVLYRMESEPLIEGAMPFTDVPEGKWYSDAIRWAASEHIVEGYGGGIFAPKDPVTREQLVTILYRCAQNENVAKALTELEYSDAGEISGWAVEAFSWAVDAGIVEGFGDGTLRPALSAERAQTAAILLRLHARAD